MITIDFVGSITLTGTIEELIENMAKNHMTIADFIAETDEHDCRIIKIKTVED